MNTSEAASPARRVMDLSYGSSAEAFRHEVADFLDRHYRPEIRSIQPKSTAFRRRAVDAGLLYRTVPRTYGGSEQAPDPLRGQVIREEFDRVGAPGEVPGVGVALLVPTLLAHGTEKQKQQFIPPTLAGDIMWCQGYSEPDAGSDLESLRTTAVLDGDSWVINGQKVWTSNAAQADYMFLLARTDPTKPRRDGLSYLLLDMHQPGVEVRPLRQITGAAGFNEVFFTDARTPADMIVGPEGGGWQVSRTTLANETGRVHRPRSLVRRLFTSLVKLARRREIDGRPAIADRTPASIGRTAGLGRSSPPGRPPAGQPRARREPGPARSDEQADAHRHPRPHRAFGARSDRAGRHARSRRRPSAQATSGG